MKYTVVTDKIEVRSLNENNKPRYIVNGTAQLANKKQIYEYIKRKDGTIRTLKEMVTPHCIESWKRQAKHSKLFVDSKHELARNAGIKAIAKDKFNEEEMKRLDNMLKGKMLPFAKITDLDIEGDSFNIYTECNSAFRDVDEDHKNYFDAIWYSLEKKFLNSISVNFADFKYATDEHGDRVIDDSKILGFSFEDGAVGGADHSIFEVAIRAIGDGIEEGEKKMADEKKQIEDEKAELAKQKEAFEKEKVDAQKVKDDEAAKTKQTEEEAKKSEIEKMKEEHAEMKKKLDEQTEAAKKIADDKASLDSAKGIVGQQPNPNAANPAGTPAPVDDKLYKENIETITKEHNDTIKIFKAGGTPIIDHSMHNFSEMVNLQAKAGNLNADLAEKNQRFIEDNAIDLRKQDSDLILNQKK